MNVTQREVGEWADSTFPQSTRNSILEHLRREVAELKASNEREEANEAADCLLLLFHFSHRRGFDLLEAAALKFDIIKRRQWGEPDADGVVEHIRETTEGE